MVVLAQFVFELPDHTFVAATNRRGSLAGDLLVHGVECPPEALNLSHRPFSLRVALDHARSAFASMAGWMKNSRPWSTHIRHFHFRISGTRFASKSIQYGSMRVSRIWLFRKEAAVDIDFLNPSHPKCLDRGL